MAARTDPTIYQHECPARLSYSDSQPPSGLQPTNSSETPTSLRRVLQLIMKPDAAYPGPTLPNRVQGANNTGLRFRAMFFLAFGPPSQELESARESTPVHRTSQSKKSPAGAGLNQSSKGWLRPIWPPPVGNLLPQPQAPRGLPPGLQIRPALPPPTRDPLPADGESTPR